MNYTEVKIVKDSIGPNNARLTTFELKYPRIIHAEVMTHRVYSRNAASSRAIPINKIIQSVTEQPFVPSYWGKNQAGMQAFEEMGADAAQEIERLWQELIGINVSYVQRFHELGCHKQIANRPLEWAQYITVIMSGTTWSNLFALRDHTDAQPEFRHLVQLMKKEYTESEPQPLKAGQWHLPYILNDESFIPEFARQVSTARCARVSYLTHDKIRDPLKDLDLYKKLLEGSGDGVGHYSPFEHVAQAQHWFMRQQSGNFKGFNQYRKMFRFEVQ